MSINGIEITDVIVFPVKKRVESSSLRAFVRIILNDQFIINGISVIEGKHGPFVSFPKEYNKTEGKGYDICFPIAAELRSYISDQILSQYELVTNKA